MDIALSIAAFLFSITGIVGCIVPIIPGVALSYVGLLCASFCSYSEISSATLWIWLAVTVAVSVIDYFLPGYFARLVGGTRASARLCRLPEQEVAPVGMIAGFFAGGLVGVILGPFFGAVIGELIHDRSDSAKAFRSGFGSFLAFIAGTGLKLVAAIWMICLVWSDTYPVVKNWIVTTF